MRRSRCEERLAGRDESPPTTGKRVVAKAVGGGVPDTPRGGHPPSLQTNLKVVRKAACPQAAAGVVGGCPLMGGHARPVGTLQASQARPAPLMGSLLRGRSPRGKPPHQGRWPRSRPEGFSPLTVGIAKLRAEHARPLRTAVNRRAREGQGRAAARRFAVGGWLTGNGRPRKARRNPPVR